MNQYIRIETRDHDFYAVCNQSVDLDGNFRARCLETGNRIQVNGWNCTVTPVTASDDDHEECQRLHERLNSANDRLPSGWLSVEA